jgi:hypothetical protein
VRLACAPGYSPCLPLASDLDCDQIAESTRPVRVFGEDPYRLDRDRDGVGCESGAEPAVSNWGVIIRSAPRKEAVSVRVGQNVLIVGWGPRSAKGASVELCAAHGPCVRSPVKISGAGNVQRFASWAVKASQVAGGRLTIRLRSRGAVRAVDFVPVR